MPPVPVVAPTPAPVRLNHVSRVKLGAFSAERAAEGDVVVGAVEDWSALPAAALGVALASFEAAETLAAVVDRHDHVVIGLVPLTAVVSMKLAAVISCAVEGVPSCQPGVVVER